MGIGAIAGIAGAAASIYGASQAGKGGDGGGGYQYVPYYSGDVDTRWVRLLREMESRSFDTPGQVAPLLQQGLNAQKNVDTGAYSQAGQTASQLYGQAATQDQQVAQIMQSLGLNAMGRQGQLTQAGTDIWNTARDPEEALRGRLQHGVQQSARAGQAARGLEMGPYGAGLEDQALSNFNMDWEDRQLGRQGTGLQGLSTANLGANQSNQLAGMDLSQMLQFMRQAPADLLTGASTPMTVGANIGNFYNNAANQYSTGVGQSLAPLAAVQSQIIPYLYAGQGAGMNAFNQFNANRAFDANQVAGGIQGAYQGLNQFSNSPAGQASNNWLQNLFGGGSEGGVGESQGVQVYGSQ